MIFVVETSDGDRFVSAFARIVLAFSNHDGSKGFEAVAGLEAGLLSGLGAAL